MRRLARPVALALALCLSLPAVADKAISAYKHGKDAEARQDYDTAYKAYKEAYDLKPKDIRYRSAYTRARFYASSAHVHKGQQLREQGKLQEALAEFERAAQIDPSNFIAAQEAKTTRTQIQKSTGPSSQAPPPSNPVSQLAQSARGPVELKPISTQPINLRMFEDAKVVYSTVGKLAGVNVLFDPDYTSRRIQIELNNVSLEQALEIIALESRTFWRPVTSNTIFVAADNAAKRRELEQSVVKVFYLSNVSSPNDLQDAVSVVRTVAAVQSVQPVASQDALVIRGTPDQVALAESLLSSIDKAKPEVIVEVAVMQVTRERIRDLGIQPFNTASVALQPNATTSTTTTQSGQAVTTPTTGLTLNNLANLNAKDFQVTISPANLSFLMSDSNTKVIQNPQIRALDNQKATLKIGDKVPVATGSFQPGIGGVGINPLVNTQFQYLDVGVNIEITPRIHSDGEVTLKMGLEISSVTGSSNIGGISQPIIGQRRIEHDIRLKEGEVNLLGGILEDSDVKSLSGWPFFSKIPIFKYLFSLEHRDHRENEIVFALVPHIVRRLDVTEQNLRPIDVGTYSTIELRRESGAVAPVTPPGGGPTPAPQSAPQPTQTPAAQAPNQAGPQPPTAAQQAQAGLGSGNAVLSFEPAQITQPLSSTFTVNVSLNGAQDAYSVPIEISYPHEILQLLNVSNGGFLERDNQPVTLVHREDPATGTLQITATRPPGSGGLSGSGTVVTLTFLAKSSGQGTLNIVRGSLRDPAMQAKPLAGAQAMVTVK